MFYNLFIIKNMRRKLNEKSKQKHKKKHLWNNAGSLSCYDYCTINFSRRVN